MRGGHRPPACPGCPSQYPPPRTPYACGDQVGTTLLTLTPDNADAGLPVIQGVYVLFGGPEQAPRAVLDGIELTNLRTSAVSVLGARLAGTTTTAAHLVLFGTGVQAWEHAVTFCDVLQVGRITVVGRNAERAQALAARIAAELGVPAEAGGDDAVAWAGEVVLGLESGAVTERELVTFTDLATGRVRRKAGVPAVVVTTGMPWQDLVVASAVMDALES